METYVTITLMGGLGNRFFQVASAYGISQKLGKKFILCRNLIQPNSHQTVEDDSYFYQSIPQHPSSIPIVIHSKIQEPGQCAFHYLPLQKSMPGNVELFGYFQTEKYFLDYRDEILKMFRPDEAFIMRAIEKTNIPKEIFGNSVFLHVRRGDFVKNLYHEMNLRSYYERALSYIREEWNIVVSSDDIEWCKKKENMPFLPSFLEKKQVYYIEHLNEVETLCALFSCKRGGICANSTFSWWGGWLNTNPEKILIFPSKIINKEWDFTDFFPKGSIVLPV